MVASDASNQGNTSPGDATQSTRQPMQISVLLAAAGTPPLDAESARLAPVRLWDAFVLAPERARLFAGHPHSLFKDRAEAIDPRHDALARMIRAVASALRSRFVAYDTAHPEAELLRGVSALATMHIEGALAGFDVRRGRATSYAARVMIGSGAPDVDPLEAMDAGVLRRFLALTTRGLTVERTAPRGAGPVTDLGAVTLALGMLDLAANPRSALRAARARLAKGERFDEAQRARVRDVGHALRETLAHAVSSATTAGATGRELVRESVLAPDVMDQFAVALARAVYDGMGPAREHPLVVPGAAHDEMLSVAPVLVGGGDGDADPCLGLYDRIEFVALPSARVAVSESVEARDARVPPPFPAALDDATMARVREGLKVPTRTPPQGRVLATQIDPADPHPSWTRTTLEATAEAVANGTAAATQVVVLVGRGASGAMAFTDALAKSLGTDGFVLAPNAATQTLAFEPLRGESLQLRRHDVSAWLDPGVARRVEYTLPPDAHVVIPARALDDATMDVALAALCTLVRDVVARGEPRRVLVVVGVPTWRGASCVVRALAARPELESMRAPLRGEGVWLVRTDVPATARIDAKRAPEETMLLDLADGLAPPLLSELATRSVLLPMESRYRARRVRLAALGGPTHAPAQRAIERAARDDRTGVTLRRALQAGVGSGAVVRAALGAGERSDVRGCIRHELGVMVSEWESARERTTATRTADLARGQLVELMFAAHPRVAVALDDALASTLDDGTDETVDRAHALDALHAVALGVRCAGTIYARDEARGTLPLGFTLRGGGADVYALVDVNVGGVPSRPFPVPYVEIGFRTEGERDFGLGLAAVLLAALHDAARRWVAETPARPASRDGRTVYAAVVDVSIDARMVPDGVRVVVPLRQGVTDVDAQKLAVDLTLALADATETSAVADWSAQTVLTGRGAGAVSLVAPVVLREIVQRWEAALRTLPRFFPVGPKGSARYARASRVTTSADLGMPAAVLAEHGVLATNVQGRAVVSRLASSARESLARVRELAMLLPMRTSSQQGNEWEVLERTLAIAWFLHANFCCAAPGALRWTPEGGADLGPLVRAHLDPAMVKLWLQRKTSRPDAVDARVREFIKQLEPTIVVDVDGKP